MSFECITGYLNAEIVRKELHFLTYTNANYDFEKTQLYIKKEGNGILLMATLAKCIILKWII